MRQAPNRYVNVSTRSNQNRAMNTGAHLYYRSTVKSNGRCRRIFQIVVRWFDDKDHRYSVIKFVIIVLLMLFVQQTLSVNSVRNVDIAILTASLEEMPGMNNLQKKESNGVQKILGLDMSGYDDWAFYSADSLIDVSELFIVRSSDADLRTNAQDCVDARIASQKEIFRDYGINQYELLENAVVFTRGDYLFYCVSENADTWSDAFIACIS